MQSPALKQAPRAELFAHLQAETADFPFGPHFPNVVSRRKIQRAGFPERERARQFFLSLPTSTKKFRQSPEIEGFYRFVYENDLQHEAYQILDGIIQRRKALRQKAKGAKGKKA